MIMYSCTQIRVEIVNWGKVKEGGREGVGEREGGLPQSKRSLLWDQSLHESVRHV